MKPSRKLTTEEKIDHVNRCEYHRGKREGICPTVSPKEAKELKKSKEALR